MPNLEQPAYAPDARSSRPRRWLPLAICGLVIVVVGLWVGAWFLVDRYVTLDVGDISISTTRGAFGDKFGAVNALFSGLAFGALVITLIVQGTELKRQGEQITLQNRAAAGSQFETGFFQLLRLHTRVKDGLDIAGLKGERAIEYFNELMKQHSAPLNVFDSLKALPKEEIRSIVMTKSLSPESRLRVNPADAANIDQCLSDQPGLIGQYFDEDLKTHLGYVQEAYYHAAQASRDSLAHYFRTLFQLLRYIDESELADDLSKRRLARVLRAQFSDAELIAIWYNSLVPARKVRVGEQEFGFPKLHKLLTRYELTQSMNVDNLIHPIHARLGDELKGRA